MLVDPLAPPVEVVLLWIRGAAIRFADNVLVSIGRHVLTIVSLSVDLIKPIVQLPHNPDAFNVDLLYHWKIVRISYRRGSYTTALSS